MNRILIVTMIIFSQQLSSQNLGDMFEEDTYHYHAAVDSIISTTYIINEYADEAPDIKYTYDDNELELHYAEASRLVYENPFSYSSKSTNRFTNTSEVLNVGFNKNGKQTSMKFVNTNDEMMNEEKKYIYDDKGRLATVIRTGFDRLRYEEGDKEIYTDTTLNFIYGKDNLIETAYCSMEMGMVMKVDREKTNDTLRYYGEFAVSGFMAEMMKELGSESEAQKEKIMDIVYNESLDIYEATEEQLGSVQKQIINKDGLTTEYLTMSEDKVVQHLKYTYKNGKTTKIEMVVGDNPSTAYDDQGNKIMAQSDFELFQYKYDESGNLIEELKLNPYTLQFEELIIHKIFYKK